MLPKVACAPLSTAYYRLNRLRRLALVERLLRDYLRARSATPVTTVSWPLPGMAVAF